MEHGRKGAKGVGEAGEKRNRGKSNSWKLQSMLNISQSKVAKGKKLRKKGEEAGYARHGRQEAWTPCPLSSHLTLPKRKI